LDNPTPSLVECLQRRGVIRGDGRRVCHHFRPAYKWLTGQMHRRVPGYSGAFPVWFWFSPKPDLRQSALLARGERGLRIELELPREVVLLSDFENLALCSQSMAPIAFLAGEPGMGSQDQRARPIPGDAPGCP